MFIVYDLIMFIVGLFYLPYLLFRLLINPGYGKGFGMRLGILPKAISERLPSKKRIWVHAVSVGEAMVAETLVEGIRCRFPDHSLVISTVTQTGSRVARRVAFPDDIVIYFPLDLSFIVKRMIRRIRPGLFITVETEIWPNFITAASREKIPIVLVNGRISPGSFRGYRKVRFLLKGVLAKIDLFLMQTPEDRFRIISLGAPPDRIRVTGNMKFDQAKFVEVKDPEIARLRNSLRLADDEELFVAGSTHPGEEKLILEAYRNLSQRYRRLRLLLAPRHPERAPRVERLVARYGFVPARISHLSSVEPPSQGRVNSALSPSVWSPLASSDAGDERAVFILDTIGQLRPIYALATIVFVGGSLVPHGGQNPIEPAILERPILFGPWLFNFQAIADALLEREAAILVSSREELEEAASRLLDDPSQRGLLGRRAKEAIKLSIGVTKRNVDLIKELFDKKRAKM